MILVTTIRGEKLSISINQIISAASHGTKSILTIGNTRDKIIVKESFPVIMELIKEARLNTSQAK